MWNTAEQMVNEGKYSFVSVWTCTDLAVVVVVTALSPPSLCTLCRLYTISEEIERN
jgi:hypothetical protein